MSHSSSHAARRGGYAVAIAVNVVLLVVINNLLSWGWFPWLTSEFEDLLPIINVALVANIAVYVLYMFYDDEPLKTVAQIVLNVLAMAVLVRALQIYPFDFSDYEFPAEISAFELSWDLLVRFVIGLAVFGTAIAIVTQIVKLIRTPATRS